MKDAPLFAIKRFAVHDGPGIRTTLFFQGCPLRCAWCHNPESLSMHSPARQTDTFSYDTNQCRRYSVDELLTEASRDAVFFASSGGGITLSGGEPLLHTAFLREFLPVAHQQGLHIALDTSGHAPQQDFTSILPWCHLVLYDLKSQDAARHKQWTGHTNERILANLAELASTGIPIWIRFPLIPEVNDTPAELDALCSLLASTPHIQQINLLPLHTIAQHKYHKLGLPSCYEKLQEPTEYRIDEINKKLSATGIPVVQGG